MKAIGTARSVRRTGDRTRIGTLLPPWSRRLESRPLRLVNLDMRRPPVLPSAALLEFPAHIVRDLRDLLGLRPRKFPGMLLGVVGCLGIGHVAAQGGDLGAVPAA